MRLAYVFITLHHLYHLSPFTLIFQVNEKCNFRQPHKFWLNQGWGPTSCDQSSEHIVYRSLDLKWCRVRWTLQWLACSSVQAETRKVKTAEAFGSFQIRGCENIRRWSCDQDIFTQTELAPNKCSCNFHPCPSRLMRLIHAVTNRELCNYFRKTN